MSISFPPSLRSGAHCLVATLSLAAVTGAQFDAYVWELKQPDGTRSATIDGDELAILLDPLCDIGYADSGRAQTEAAATGRFRFDWEASSQARPTLGSLCIGARVVALSGPCDCPLIPIHLPNECVDEQVAFGGNGAYPHLSEPFLLAASWEVDVGGECLRTAAVTDVLTLDCQILAHFTNLTFTPPLSGSLGSPDTISVGVGGVQSLALTGPQALAGRTCVVLGSASGPQPGLPLAGGVLPLNPDPYLLLTLSHPAGAALLGALGVLDSNGLAGARFELHPGSAPALAGLVLHHALLVLDLSGHLPAVSFASNAAAVALVP